MRRVFALVLLALFTSHPASADPAEPGAARLRETDLTAHIRFLSDDLLEGRAPAGRGDEVAMRYVAAAFERLGLKPFGDGADPARSYVQRFPLVGLSTRVVTPPLVRGGGGEMKLRPGEDTVIVSGVQKARARIADAPIVFV